MPIYEEVLDDLDSLPSDKLLAFLPKAIVLVRLENGKIVDSKTRCWLHINSKNKKGRVYLKINDKFYATYQLSAYIYLDFNLLSNLQINHKDNCPNKDCWNPQHIYIGTARENTQDMINLGNHVNARKTHCPKGHLYDKERINKYGIKERRCRVCYNENCRNSYKKRVERKNKSV